MRLIDADALGVGRCSRDLLPAAYCAGWNGLVNLIEDAPTIDAVPVVRCKDCKHFVQTEPYDPCECMKWTVKWGVAYTEPNGFCSYGERRSDE